jgi:hypothetical protein
MICTCETKSDERRIGVSHEFGCPLAEFRLPFEVSYGNPSPPKSYLRQLEREFWERCALQRLGPDPSEIAGAADALTAEWRKRFGEGK